MNTPPMAGVWMKYANMNSDRSPPFVAMIAAVLRIVISTGTQSALEWTAIHGNAARSSRTWIGRMAARNASMKPIRVGWLGALSVGVVGWRRAVGSAVASVRSAAWADWAARERRRASARSVLLARATVSPGGGVLGGTGGRVLRIVVQPR
jgi:hypothetical protein